MIPRATYRIQFRNGMGFARAIEVIPYLRRLGVSHVYASPLFAAVEGSTHGYDVVDYNAIDPVLGGMDGLLAFSDRLREAGMGLILDIVPNHMAASLQNRWWRDIIEWGAASAFAGYFDVDWSGKLTLPILSSAYEKCLRAGEISIKLDERNASLALAYCDNLLPLHPPTYGTVLAPVTDPLARTLAALAAEAHPTGGTWKQGFRRLLAAHSCGGLERELSVLSRDLAHIDAICRLQPWHLTDWRDASHSLSYRRFFEIAGLAGLRVEEKQVFDDAHRLTLALVERGVVTGLRVDHVDGLADPKAYLRRLRAAAGSDLYLVVEKILAQDEDLPVDWPVHGTSGYEFISSISQAFIDPEGRAALERAYLEQGADGMPLEAERRRSKLLIVRENFAGELRRLAELAGRAGAGFGQSELELTVSELIAAFPVYRTYGDENGMNDHDRTLLESVAAVVANTVIGIDHDLLRSFVAILTDGKGGLAAELRRRFQQLSSAAMAKAVEDTMFYRWHAMVALNEVGCDPAQTVGGSDHFHRAMARRRRSWPHCLLAAATHDTKHGEDARARLYGLSERPESWLAAMARWDRMNRRAAPTASPAPAPELQWLIYQSLASIWPSPGDPRAPRRPADLADRLVAFLEKALREAKLRTSWTAVDAGYERSVTNFVAQLLDARNHAVLDDVAASLLPFIHAGWITALAQTLLRLTAPGVPDIYQGSERGDFSLVDPDNRRPVDFGSLAASLAAPFSKPDQADLFAGRMKQRLVQLALGLRRREAHLFAFGSYEPLEVAGPRSSQLLAFLRRNETAAMMAIVPRLTFAAGWPDAADEFWRDTRLVLPAGLAPFFNVLTGETVKPAAEITIAALLKIWPVALLSTGQPAD